MQSHFAGVKNLHHRTSGPWANPQINGYQKNTKQLLRAELKPGPDPGGVKKALGERDEAEPETAQQSSRQLGNNCWETQACGCRGRGARVTNSSKSIPEAATWRSSSRRFPRGRGAGTGGPQRRAFAPKTHCSPQALRIQRPDTTPKNACRVRCPCLLVTHCFSRQKDHMLAKF